MEHDAAIVLINPKFPHNVGSALRACAAFGATTLRWTGSRVVVEEITGRLPREERMRGYNEHVDWKRDANGLRSLIRDGYTPVAVELRSNAEDLTYFQHPEKAVYVFGPEDGSLPKGYLHACHRFVYIPTHFCLNLAAATNVVLWDRRAKARYSGIEEPLPLKELLA